MTDIRVRRLAGLLLIVAPVLFTTCFALPLYSGRRASSDRGWPCWVWFVQLASCWA
jgi:hypothetical protein